MLQVQSFDVLLNWILAEYADRESILGLNRSLFFTPERDSPCALPDLFGNYLATPIGPAGGPHTQLAQNIVCAWLSGGRFIELKTVQVMDELQIPRPCIDMEDEGYNVEWSQELKLDQSAHEYINAWALIHILHRLLGHEGRVPVGTIFNMSVGYDLEGVKSASMNRFMDKMADASQELNGIYRTLRARFPQFADIEIPAKITNNVTLSTMHGCPPDEIERIARYLLTERGLHTAIKLNPTLLGKETLRSILHDDLGFSEIHIPEAVFDHDLQYGQAVELIKSLKDVADRQDLTFGVKLSNTLPAINHKNILPGSEMYMSGRALYPITINLFHRLAGEFGGDLNVSYSGGADALNVSAILASGARPVTAATDLLKPGGYSRFLQYIENLEFAMRIQGAESLDAFARHKLANLEQAAAEALANPRFKKSLLSHGLPKVESGLELFDCIAAPCMEKCAVCQDVPQYAWMIAHGNYDGALEAILARNPLPSVTGHVCTHLCQTRCTRSASNYDEPVAIRALKRIAAEKGHVELSTKEATRYRVAVIGSGPSGLSAAYFLALNGIRVTIFEAQDSAGGMMRLAPIFRLPSASIQKDIDRIARMGVDIRLSHPISRPPEALLSEGFDAVYVASGFQKDAYLDIEGVEGQGVISALDLLQKNRRGELVELGSRVLVIGGGDTALDAARVAQRLSGHPATIVYRRSKVEMPAGADDKSGAFEEGIFLEELASPTRIILKDGRVVALECVRNRLAEAGPDGRRYPVPIAGSEFVLAADSIVVGVGQSPDISFLNGSQVALNKNGAIKVNPQTGLAGPAGIYAGGDAVRGPESIIAACADGRRAAESICAEFNIQVDQPEPALLILNKKEITQVKKVRARREAQAKPWSIPPAQRNGFELIEEFYSPEAAQHEASRCLQCSSFCDKCVEVCPNRANHTYYIKPTKVRLPRLACQNGALVPTGEETFRIEQNRQIIHLRNLCNECGNCETFCVHRDAPYKDKPRLFFSKIDFEQANDNAFHVERIAEDWIIRRRSGGKEMQLRISGGMRAAALETDLICATFSLPDMLVTGTQLKRQFEGELSLVEAAEMYVILEGLRTTLTCLPFVGWD